LLLLFGYDYTLDESGVEKDENTHKQEFTNKNAKIGVRALAMLGGFRSEWCGVGLGRNYLHYKSFAFGQKLDLTQRRRMR
jgi:hypothetical protein